MHAASLPAITRWRGADPAFDRAAIARAVARVREPAFVVQHPESGHVGVAIGGALDPDGTHPALGALPALWPEWLGDRAFLEAHGVRFPYVAGAMANGIASVPLVVEMGRAGMLGFFGAAGLDPARVEGALVELAAAGIPFGSNLIHSPQEPALESRIVDLYLARGVTRVSASAYMDLTPAVVRYAASGLREEAGRVVRENHLFAKISRPQVARRFMGPAPGAMLEALVSSGQLTAEEARLAARVPVATELTVEADSGGHTDNQALTAVFPSVVAARAELARDFAPAAEVRLGAAGGLGTPEAVAAAFSLGAAFVVTGSVNQSAVESGLSAQGKKLLAQAALDDVMMAPAADMFEMGVQVQVLRRGAMFGPRAHKLYELYRSCASLDEIPAEDRASLEKDLFHERLEDVWSSTKAFFEQRDPAQVERAEREPKHKMALVFRSYLGRSSRWAIDGATDHALDFQIWCGPAMGAFNAWARGSFLEAPEGRTVVQIARNLLEGAAVVTRAQQLRAYGAPVPAEAFAFAPRPLS
jgi:PfaD family protein